MDAVAARRTPSSHSGPPHRLWALVRPQQSWSLILTLKITRLSWVLVPLGLSFLKRPALPGVWVGVSPLLQVRRLSGGRCEEEVPGSCCMGA